MRALEWSAQMAVSVGRAPYHWKWLLLALHNAVQGYMVVALEKGNGLLALRPKVARRWLEAFEGKGPYPVEKLDDFMPLYEKVKNPKYFETPFPASTEHDNRITQLNTLRGQFVHFTPRGWQLELAGLPDVLSAAVDLPSWAITDADALWHKPSHVNRTKAAVRRLKLLSVDAQSIGGG